MKRRGTAATLLLAVLLTACGGGPATPSPDPNALHVAGTYIITRAYISNTCIPEIPGVLATVTGTVTHAPGATQFTLANSDGGNFGATIQPDASFTSGIRHQIGANGEAYDLLFEGQFSVQGFRAMVSVDLFRAAAPCRSVLDWTGMKQGAPNVIP